MFGPHPAGWGVGGNAAAHSPSEADQPKTQSVRVSGLLEGAGQQGGRRHGASRLGSGESAHGKWGRVSCDTMGKLPKASKTTKAYYSVL